MTRNMIEITFGNALMQANQLDECAETMRKLANSELESVSTGLRVAWQGEAANAYLEKMVLTQANMIKTSAKLTEIAETLRKIARVFRESELKALEIAEQRTYGNL